MGLNLKGYTGIKDIKLEIIKVQIEFKALELDEITFG